MIQYELILTPIAIRVLTTYIYHAMIPKHYLGCVWVRTGERIKRPSLNPWTSSVTANPFDITRKIHLFQIHSMY